jgi:hypothetical protein
VFAVRFPRKDPDADAGRNAHLGTDKDAGLMKTLLYPGGDPRGMAAVRCPAPDEIQFG